MKPLYSICFLVLIALLINKRKSENQEKVFKCGSQKEKIEPRLVKESTIKRQSHLKRKLNNKNGFRDINIVLDYKNIESEIDLNSLNQYKNLIINSMNKAAQTIKKLIQINSSDCFDFGEDFIDQNGFKYWDKERFGITNKKPNFTTCDFDIDLLIFTRFFNETEMENNNETTYSSEVLYRKTIDKRPIVGAIYLNKDTNLSLKNSDKLLDFIFIHSITHILGFSSYYHSYFNYSFTSKDIYGNSRKYINSTKVVQFAKKYFNCNYIKGVELEDADSVSGMHWESRILLGEYMNSIYLEEQVISEFTLSFLDDLGYYKINYYTGGLMGYGKHKGCKFVQEKCIINRDIDPYFENEFYISINNQNMDPSCSSGRQSRTYFAFWTKSYIPYYYDYFGINVGGLEQADYCLVPRKLYAEQKDGYYVGNCNFGFGGYGTEIPYKEGSKETFYKSGEIEEITGEKYSDHSFCYQSSLTKNNETKFNEFSKVVRAVCYETFCSSKSLTIKIHDNYVVCPRAGGNIVVKGFGGFLMCPDYNLICSGTVLCNDLFDCVKKNSTAKSDSFSYDYMIKTSQSIEKALEGNFDNETNYELSDDGKCIKNCKQCSERKCIECRNNYGLVGNKENEDELTCVNISLLGNYYVGNNSIYYKCSNNCLRCYDDMNCYICENNYGIVHYNSVHNDSHGSIFKSGFLCKDLNELNIGYYKVNSNHFSWWRIFPTEVYYKCINYCEICSNDTYCIKCRDQFEYNNIINECYIPNCEKYDLNGTCEKCIENYAFKEEEKNICTNKNNFIDGTYYTKDGGIRYYSCNGEGENHIKNCYKCDYNEDNNLAKLYCKECINGFTLIEDKEINKCYDKKELNNQYFSLNSTHMKNCSNEINGCLECENKEKCIKCKEGFYSLNNNGKKCANKNQINPIDEYYFDENNRAYYFCNTSISNCKKCVNNNTCSLCNDGFCSLNGNKKKCTKISILGNNYYQDPKDPSNYQPCSNIDLNCLNCSSFDTCINCIEGYKINIEQNECMEIIRTQKKDSSNSISGGIIAVIIGGGAVVLGSIIMIIICACRNREKKMMEKDPEQTDSSVDQINNNINCRFQTNNGNITNIPIECDKTMNELLFYYLKHIGKSELFNNPGITFVFNNNIIDFNCPKKVIDYFGNCVQPLIYVHDDNNVIGGNLNQDKIKVTFKTMKGLSKDIFIEKEKTVKDLIISFLKEVKRPDLFNKSDQIQFLFDAKKINHNNVENIERFLASSPTGNFLVIDLNDQINIC